MGIFSSIKNAIFGRKKQAPAQDQGQQRQQPQANQAPAGQAQPAPTPADVDVDAVLAEMAAEKGQKLNYKTSIVDLMKLLDLDPSLANRKELAEELGYTGARDGSAEMNIWLHREVMRQLAANGGKVPAGLTD